MILKEGGKEAVDHFASHVSKGIKLASDDTSVVTGEATGIAGLNSALPDALDPRSELYIPRVQDATPANTNVYDPNGAKSFENHAFSNMKEVLNHAESTDGSSDANFIPLLT